MLYKQIQEAGICDIVEERLNLVSLNDDFLKLRRVYLELDCSNPAKYFFLNVTNPDPELCTSIFSPDIESKSLQLSILMSSENMLVLFIYRQIQM